MKKLSLAAICCALFILPSVAVTRSASFPAPLVSWTIPGEIACLLVRGYPPDAPFQPAEILAAAREEMEERDVSLMQIAVYEEGKSVGEGALAFAEMNRDGTLAASSPSRRTRKKRYNWNT